ncbi:MAG: hypothetical protein JNK85_06690 [Verrucomicrobiales bacterium]|nr:hypothetical protein [Verrucomicrobiales bacterium]
MISARYMNALIMFVLLIGILGAGCKTTKPVTPSKVTIPPPPTISMEELDKRLRESREALRRESEAALAIQQKLNDEKAAATAAENARLRREIEERTERIAFLRGEINSLLSQRKALEIYYQQKENDR